MKPPVKRGFYFKNHLPMKTILFLIPAFIFCTSCKFGETDKQTPVHESEELNINEKKNQPDSSLIIDTLHR